MIGQATGVGTGVGIGGGGLPVAPGGLGQEAPIPIIPILPAIKQNETPSVNVTGPSNVTVSPITNATTAGQEKGGA